MKALDADVLIGFLDPAEAHHQAAVRLVESLLSERERLMTGSSVYSEVLVHAVSAERRQLVDDFLDDIGIEVIPVDKDVARAAAGLRARHRSLRLPDALSLAAALSRGAALVTFDRRLRRIAVSELA